MEKIVVKPTALEINIKGNLKEGFGDAFAYEGGTDEERRLLGSLYVIGNVKEDGVAEASMDMAYVVNLVSSLAKREYYAHIDLQPRQAFSAALRKVNDVIEEFFKNKNLKLDVGVFAIAGDNIYISKVGKFKVVLARENDTIDILNNISLFTKDMAQEKEFSNVVSGTVKEGDKILAYFPSRQMVAREKSLKASLLKLNAQEFSEKVASVIETKPDFACCALHITLDKFKEPAIAPKKVRPVKIAEAPVALAAAAVIKNKPKIEVAKEEETPEPVEIPKIIPSEFAMGKKHSAIASAVSRLRAPSMNRKNARAIMFGVGALVLIIVALSAKSVFFKSPEEKLAKEAIENASQSIAEAQTKIEINDLASARRILGSSLAAISKIDSQDATDKAKEVSDLIDKIDNAQVANLTLAGEINNDLGSALLIQPRGNDLVAFVDKGDAGALVSISNSNTTILGDTSDLAPHLSVGNSERTVFMNSGSGQLVILSKDGKIQTGSSIPVITDASYYEGNAYIIEGGTIKKISDISEGTNAATTWLAEGQTVSGTKIGVDGNVYTIGESGVLTTYFKGKKVKEFETGIPVDGNYKMVASADLDYIYLIHKTLGRFYILNKETGAIIETIKSGAGHILVDATITNDGTMYILSVDNKIWKLE